MSGPLGGGGDFFLTHTVYLNTHLTFDHRHRSA